MLTRRKFLLGLGGSATAAVASTGYVRWAEPHWLEVTTTHVPIGAPAKSSPAIRVLHLSDFHASPVVSYDFIAESIETGINLRPDLIAITGDFFTDQLEGAEWYAKILAQLPQSAPTFACLGNHDGGAWSRRAGGYTTTREVRALLRAAGITCLHNESHALEIRGRAVQLIGLGDLWSGECQPDLAFAKVPTRAGELRVVLNHNPDAKSLLRPFDWDLLLAGHTHGGQLRLPFFGTPFAPVVDKRFVEGLHRWEGRWLHVTRGVGNLHGVRFNCRPQVNLLTLT
jgi:uncharacterized protein